MPRYISPATMPAVRPPQNRPSKTIGSWTRLMAAMLMPTAAWMRSPLKSGPKRAIRKPYSGRLTL